MRQNNNHLLLLLIFLAVLVIYVVYVIVQDGQTVEEWKNSLEAELRVLNDTLADARESASTTTISTPTTTVLTTAAIESDVVTLQNVQFDEPGNFAVGKNIFFILSTVLSDGKVKLTARQACAIESAARANPDHKVFPLFVTASWYNRSDPQFMAPLQQYCNIRARHVDLSTYAVGTPLEDLFRKGALQNSTYIVEHTADVLRLLTLYKYGGTYLDTDVVVRRSLDNLLLNFLGSEGSGYVANGVMNLQATGYGHQFAEACVRDLAEHFNGKEWAANGPFMVTRNLQKFCNESKVDAMTREKCGGELTVYPPDTFYRIRYPRHAWFFYPEHTDEVMEAIKADVLVHMWNAATKGISLNVTSTAAYIKLAAEFCPHVLRSCGDKF